MADTTSTYTYQGNPGYVFDGINEGAPLNPGDKVELTSEQAESVGEDFVSSKSKPKADQADTKES